MTSARTIRLFVIVDAVLVALLLILAIMYLCLLYTSPSPRD